MAFLIIVETRDLTGVTLLLFLLQDLGIGVSSRGLLLLPLVPEPLLFIFSVLFFSRLCHIVTRRGWLWIFELRFFGAGRVLGALGLYLRKNIMGRAVAPEATDIQIPDYGAKS